MSYPNVMYCEDMDYWLGALSRSMAQVGIAQRAERTCLLGCLVFIYRPSLFPTL